MVSIREPVPVKLKIAGQKYRGHITRRDMDTPMIDVTYGGLIPGGPPPDRYRTLMPGWTSTTLTVRIGGIARNVAHGQEARVKIGQYKRRGTVVRVEWYNMLDMGPAYTTMTIELTS